MRGTEKKQATMLTLLSPDRVVPEKEPPRRVKALADAALADDLPPKNWTKNELRLSLARVPSGKDGSDAEVEVH